MQQHAGVVSSRFTGSLERKEYPGLEVPQSIGQIEEWRVVNMHTENFFEAASQPEDVLC